MMNWTCRSNEAIKGGPLLIPASTSSTTPRLGPGNKVNTISESEQSELPVSIRYFKEIKVTAMLLPPATTSSKE
jgi:hypothetical protein